MTTPLPIALAADRRFSIPMGLAVFSLLESAKPTTRYHIHLLCDEVDPHVLAQIDQICRERGHLCQHHELKDALHNIATTEDFPSVAFARFLLPQLLPDEVDLIFYIDADEMVHRDLSPAFEAFQAGHLLAGVTEAGCQSNPQFAAYISHLYEHFKVSSQDGLYFNSGQILLSLKACREAQLCERMMRHAQALPDFIEYPDQDVMNVLCNGRIQLLPLAYCVVPHYAPIYHQALQTIAQHGVKVDAYGAEEITSALRSPILQHFVSADKPFVLCPDAVYQPYFRLWRRSPWRRKLPYLPKKLEGALRSSSKSRILYAAMRCLLFIPWGYEIYWCVARRLPNSLLSSLFSLCGWKRPAQPPAPHTR